MTGKGWITGDDIRSRPMCHIPDSEWERVFGKKPKLNIMSEEDRKAWDKEDYERSIQDNI